MARLARVVVPGLPHHITQRGNRRQQTFFRLEDYALHLELMGQWCGEHGVQVWGLLPDAQHVHLIAVPHSADGLRRAIGESHRRYTRRSIFVRGGGAISGKAASFVMDEPYLLATTRYVELNPVRAGLVTGPSEYPWSSARAHLTGRDDGLVQVAPLLGLAPNWRRLLTSKVGGVEGPSGA